MRTILDLFRLTPYPKIEYIYVGKLKILVLRVENIKQLKPWIMFKEATNSVLYIYENLSDIYMFDDFISLIEVDFLILIKIKNEKK